MEFEIYHDVKKKKKKPFQNDHNVDNESIILLTPIHPFLSWYNS